MQNLNRLLSVDRFEGDLHGRRQNLCRRCSVLTAFCCGAATVCLAATLVWFGEGGHAHSEDAADAANKLVQEVSCDVEALEEDEGFATTGLVHLTGCSQVFPMDAPRLADIRGFEDVIAPEVRDQPTAHIGMKVQHYNRRRNGGWGDVLCDGDACSFTRGAQGVHVGPYVLSDDMALLVPSVRLTLQPAPWQLRAEEPPIAQTTSFNWVFNSSTMWVAEGGNALVAGDTRIFFEMADTRPVSVIGGVSGGVGISDNTRLAAPVIGMWAAPHGSGETIGRVRLGSVDATTMISDFIAAETTATWAARVLIGSISILGVWLLLWPADACDFLCGLCGPWAGPLTGAAPQLIGRCCSTFCRAALVGFTCTALLCLHGWLGFVYGPLAAIGLLAALLVGSPVVTQAMCGSAEKKSPAATQEDAEREEREMLRRGDAYGEGL